MIVICFMYYINKYNNLFQPINLINTCIELAPPGKIPPGVTEIPFEMPLRPRQAVSPGYPGLLETYHGVFVNIMYNLKCSMKRSFLNKPLNASCQFFVQYRQVSINTMYMYNYYSYKSNVVLILLGKSFYRQHFCVFITSYTVLEYNLNNFIY